jgi:hypothetical protein
VHGINEAKTFPDFTLCETFCDLLGDVDELSPPGNVEPKFLSI